MSEQNDITLIDHELWDAIGVAAERARYAQSTIELAAENIENSERAVMLLFLALQGLGASVNHARKAFEKLVLSMNNLIWHEGPPPVIDYYKTESRPFLVKYSDGVVQSFCDCCSDGRELKHGIQWAWAWEIPT